MPLYLPIVMVVLANVGYHLCAKAITTDVNQWLSLAITYAIAFILTFGIYLFSSHGSTLRQDLHTLPWASFALGGIVIGLELGNILMYQAGWDVSVGSLVCNIALAIALVFVGAAVFGEQVTSIKVAGVLVCCAGIWMVTR